MRHSAGPPGNAGDTLEVHGGWIDLAALHKLARFLEAAAVNVSSDASTLLSTALDGELALTALVAPTSWGHVEHALIGALNPARGLPSLAEGLLHLAWGCHRVAGDYAAAEAAADRGGDALAAAGAHLAGTLSSSSVNALFGLGGAANPLMVRRAMALSAPWVRAALGGFGSAPMVKGSGRGTVQLPPQVGRAAGDVLESFARVGGVERLVGLAPAYLEGWLGDSRGGSGAGFPVGSQASVPTATRRIASSAARFGLLEGSVAVRAEVSSWRSTRGDIGLAGLLDLLVDDSEGGHRAAVKVVRVTGEGGSRRWIVLIPGTERWSPVSSSAPFDLTSDVQVMSEQGSAARSTVLAALAAAGIPPGDPVVLVGHSQGGMVAAQLAGEPGLRQAYRITAVVTAGSPIAQASIPDSISILAIEHRGDAVPQLDGLPNPERSNWVTVRLDGPGQGGAVGEHELVGYRDSAARIEASSDPRIRQVLGFLLPAQEQRSSVEVLSVIGRRLENPE